MRSIREIAWDISNTWAKVSPHAEPYLYAMMELGTVNDAYYLDSGREIVARFLCNAGTFRGPNARRLKAELNAHLNKR